MMSSRHILIAERAGLGSNSGELGAKAIGTQGRGGWRWSKDGRDRGNYTPRLTLHMVLAAGWIGDGGE
jgi:hypothetical protein